MSNTTPPRKRRTCDNLWTSSIRPLKMFWNKSINILDSGASSVLERWRDDKVFPIKFALCLSRDWTKSKTLLKANLCLYIWPPLSGRLFFGGNISQTLMRRTWRWALYEKAIHRFNRRKPNQWHIDTRRHSVGYLETAGEDNTRVSSCSFQCTVCKSANVSCRGWIWVWLALSIKFFWCRGAGQTQEGIFDIIFCHFNGKNTPTFCHRRLQNQQNITTPCCSSLFKNLRPAVRLAQL